MKVRELPKAWREEQDRISAILERLAKDRYKRETGPIPITATLSLKEAKELAVCIHGGFMATTYFYASEVVAEEAGKAFSIHEQDVVSTGRYPELDKIHPVYGQVYAVRHFDY